MYSFLISIIYSLCCFRVTYSSSTYIFVRKIFLCCNSRFEKLEHQEWDLRELEMTWARCGTLLFWPHVLESEKLKSRSATWYTSNHHMKSSCSFHPEWNIHKCKQNWKCILFIQCIYKNKCIVFNSIVLSQREIIVKENKDMACLQTTYLQ